MLKYQCIVLAGGSGSRSGLKINKLLYKLDNKTIIEMSILPFLKDKNCQKIVLVGNEDIFQEIETLHNKKIAYRLGGTTRQESVRNGLSLIDSEYVLIHDGARPHINSNLINRVLEALENHDSVTPVIPLKDSIKKVKDDYVVESLNRDEYRLIQTPQGFKTDKIKEAHQLAKSNDNNDDATLVEIYLQEKVYTVLGEYSNIKYTYISDFEDKKI